VFLTPLPNSKSPGKVDGKLPRVRRRHDMTCGVVRREKSKGYDIRTAADVERKTKSSDKSVVIQGSSRLSTLEV
jgi:hypothetical protein